MKNTFSRHICSSSKVYQFKKNIYGDSKMNIGKKCEVSKWQIFDRKSFQLFPSKQKLNAMPS